MSATQMDYFSAAEDGVTPRLDGQSRELQVRDPMVVVRYYNPQVTSSSFVEGGWYHTGDVGIIENGKMGLSGRMKDIVIVHGVSYSISKLTCRVSRVSHRRPYVRDRLDGGCAPPLVFPWSREQARCQRPRAGTVATHAQGISRRRLKLSPPETRPLGGHCWLVARVR